MTKTLPPLALVLLLPACMLEPTGHETIEYRELTRMQIESGAGDIEFRRAEGDTILAEATIYGKRTKLREDLADNEVRLWTDCPRVGSCGIDWIVYVPDGLTLDLHTGAGDVKILGVAAHNIALDTGSGDLVLRDATANSLTADTGSGDVSAELLAAPSVVGVDTGSGDVDVIVPAGAYDIDLDTGWGDRNVRGIDNVEGAENRISVSTGAGDINILAGG